MTPHRLEEEARNADRFVLSGGTREHAIFMMLRVLLQHEADKQAERNLREDR